jgi:hypothetical protein
MNTTCSRLADRPPEAPPGKSSPAVPPTCGGSAGPGSRHLHPMTYPTAERPQGGSSPADRCIRGHERRRSPRRPSGRSPRVTGGGGGVVVGRQQPTRATSHGPGPTVGSGRTAFPCATRRNALTAVRRGVSCPPRGPKWREVGNRGEPAASRGHDPPVSGDDLQNGTVKPPRTVARGSARGAARDPAGRSGQRGARDGCSPASTATRSTPRVA